MPTYERVTLYKVWYSVEVVAENEEDAEELFDSLDPKLDGVIIEYSYEESWTEEL